MVGGGTALRIAQVVSTWSLADLPSAVVERAKLAALDHVGVSAAGADSPAALAARECVTELAGGSTIIGSSLRTEPSMAAFVNGTQAHALEFDDTSSTLFGHPSATIFPAALAAAEERKASGADLLLGYVAGLEVATKLGAAMNPTHYERGWHATATLGAIGAAAAAGRVLDLGPDRSASALGIAASSAGGLRANIGTATKAVQAGNAARAGVLAARLAMRGIGAASDALDGALGFAAAFAPGTTVDRVADRLGLPWELLDPGLQFKLYPCCAFTHAAIDAVLALRRQHGTCAADPVSADVRVMTLAAATLRYDRPENDQQARFSMPYCVATALVHGTVEERHFAADALRDPTVRSIMPRITMTADPHLDSSWRAGQPRPAIVTLVLRDGRQISQRVDQTRGSPEKLDPTALVAKFRTTAQALGSERVERLVDLVLSLDRVPAVDDLTALLRVDVTGAEPCAIH